MEIAELKQQTIKWTLTVVFVAIAMYIIVRWDVVTRAKESYFKAEKSYAYHLNKDLKKRELTEKLTLEKYDIEKKYKMNKFLSFLRIISGVKGRLKEQEYKDMLEDAQNEYERLMEENDLKYAFVWYQTAVEMFCPPISKWVKLSLPKMYDMAVKLEEEQMYILAREGYESIVRFNEKYPKFKRQTGPEWEKIVEESKNKIPIMWEKIEGKK